jgi:hypothetical protein
MPWHWKAKKVVASCDKPRGGASFLRSADYLIGKPAVGEPTASMTEYIGYRGDTGGIETSKYPEE